MGRTYRDLASVERCLECLRPVLDLTPDERLYVAAKRVLKLLDAQIDGRYYGPSEDIQAARELGEAITAIEASQAQQRERTLVQR
jgi:hypothetical protein